MARSKQQAVQEPGHEEDKVEVAGLQQPPFQQSPASFELAQNVNVAGQLRTVSQQLVGLRNLNNRVMKRLSKLEETISQHQHGTGVKSWRNGVHIDIDGLYWMRRPDGWHQMHISNNSEPGFVRVVPRLPVQRLVEPPRLVRYTGCPML